MAFEDLEEELENLRNNNDVYEINTYDDEGDLELSGSGMNWDETSLSAIVGGNLASAGPDVQDALRWVLQGGEKENYHIWEGARKLGIDLKALGVSSANNRGKLGFNESTTPTTQAMGSLYQMLGIGRVTQRKGESTKDFEHRMEDPRNWDVMGDMKGHSTGDVMSEFMIGSGSNQIPVTKALKNIATGFVDRGAYTSKKDYKLAVTKASRQLVQKLPFALKEQARYYATRPAGSPMVGYHQILGNLGMGEFNRNKYEQDFGETYNLSSTLKDIANVFNARGTDGADWHDLHTGLQAWMQPASNYKTGEILDELARSGDEGLLLQVAENLGAIDIRERGVDPTVASFDLPMINFADLNATPYDEIQRELNTVRGITNYKLVEGDMANITRKKRRKVDPQLVQGNSNESNFAPVEREEIPLLTMSQEVVPSAPSAGITIPAGYRRAGDDNLIIHNDPQGTPEWKKARDPMLTAADAHAVNANSKYGAAALKRKWDTVTGDNSVESRYNENFERGHSKEELARSWYEKKYGTPVAEVGLIENPEYQGIGASVDGLIGSSGLFEAKAPARKFSDITKDHAYYAQVQMQMAVTNREWADLVQIKEKDRSAFGKIEHEYKVDRIQRDEGFIRSNMPKWQAHGQNFRIASGQATPEDQEFIGRQQEYSDWWNKAIPEAEADENQSRREAFAKARRADHTYRNKLEGREADFEARLLERAQSPDASSNLKDTMKAALIEADEEIQKKKESSMLGQVGAMAGATLGYMGGMLGGALNVVGGMATPFGRAFGSAGQGDYLGAISGAVGNIPVAGALVSGAITAVKGQLDKATEVADIVGTAKEMGISYNALNSTQQMGVALGISKQDSTRMIATTTSAAQGMSTGNMDEAAKMVVESRGYINFADLQAYEDDPIKLAQIAKSRMSADGLSEKQQADLLRRSGLGSANRVTDSTTETRDNLVRAKTQNNMDTKTAQNVFDKTGEANVEIDVAQRRPIISLAEEGNLGTMLDGVVTAVNFVEDSFTKLANAAIGSGEGLGKLQEGLGKLMKMLGVDVGSDYNYTKEVSAPSSSAISGGSGRISGVNEANLKPAASKLKTDDFGVGWKMTEPLSFDDGMNLDMKNQRKTPLKTLDSDNQRDLDYLTGLRTRGIDPLTNNQYDKRSLGELDKAIQILKEQSKIDVSVKVSDDRVTATVNKDGQRAATAQSVTSIKR